MTRTELQNELTKLNDAQRLTLRKHFPGQKVTFLNYDGVTDAITFNVIHSKSEFQWTAVLTRKGKMIDLRCYKQVKAGSFGYGASR